MITGNKCDKTDYLLISEIIKVDPSCYPVRIVIYDRSNDHGGLHRYAVHTECMDGITEDANYISRYNGCYVSDLDIAIEEFHSRVYRTRKNRDAFADSKYRRICEDLSHNYA